jgi:DNA-binding transcriptional LysR family regulator
VAVARERKFTRVAEKLHITQPPLSRQIQQLEEEFGVTLIDRGSRPLALTDAGRLLLEQAVQVIDRMDEIKAMLGRIREAKKLRFSIGFVPSTLYGYLPEVIRRYRKARPRVELTLLEPTTVEQIRALSASAAPRSRPADRALAVAQREALRCAAPRPCPRVAHRPACTASPRRSLRCRRDALELGRQALLGLPQVELALHVEIERGLGAGETAEAQRGARIIVDKGSMPVSVPPRAPRSIQGALNIAGAPWRH